MRKIVFALLGICIVVALAAGIYIAYVFASYERIADNVELSPLNPQEEILRVGDAYSIVTYNIGYGAHSPEYSFFMDGGEHSWALSREDVLRNIEGACTLIDDTDILLLQEVDEYADRSYQVVEDVMVKDAFPGHSTVTARNYKSSYLFYPFTRPIGKSMSAIMTLSKYQIGYALRRSLPVEEGIRKFFDLDRCYSVQILPIQGGKSLYVYNVHLSAYTEDGLISRQQLDMLLLDMEAAYAEGHYVICGGDFNMDLAGNSSEIFRNAQETPNWALPFPEDALPEDFSLRPPLAIQDTLPTCRNADKPYTPGESFVTIVDGFIISNNVECVSVAVTQGDFLYSDHNPVRMEFVLRSEEAPE